MKDYFFEPFADPLTSDLFPWLTTQLILRSPLAQVSALGESYSI